MYDLKQYMQQYYDEKKKYSPNWNSELEPAITLAMERRAELLQLSPEELESQVKALFYNLDYIRIIDKKEMEALGQSANAYAMFFPSNRKIVINEEALGEIVQRNNEEEYIEAIAESMMHEIGHAITYNREKSEYGVAGKEDPSTGRYQYVALDEVLRESEANYMHRLPTNSEIDNFKMKTKGYSNLTFFVPMLAATFGVSETDIFRNSQNSKEQLDAFLLSKMQDKQMGAQLLEGMYKNLNVLYTYSITDNQTNKEANTRVAMQNLCNFAIKAQDFRISQLERVDDISKYIEDEKYNKTKLETVMKQAIEESSYIYGENSKNQILGNVNEYHKYSRRKIEAMDILTKNYSMFKNIPNGQKIFFEIFKKFKTKEVTQNDIQVMNNRFGINMNGIGENTINIPFAEKRKRHINIPIDNSKFKTPILKAMENQKEEKDVYINDVDRYIYKGNSKFLKTVFGDSILKGWASKLQNKADAFSAFFGGNSDGASNRPTQVYKLSPKKSIYLYNIGDLEDYHREDINQDVEQRTYTRNDTEYER